MGELRENKIPHLLLNKQAVIAEWMCGLIHASE